MAFDHPHLRRNPLTGEAVLVSPHRLNRPWQGKQETLPPERKATYDAQCYLCPGNARAGGEKNPAYGKTFVFDNDFSALLMDGGEGNPSTHELLQAKAIQGICRVICFSPRHDLTLAEMPASSILAVVDTWAEQFQLLGSKPEISYVQIFENKGMIMGCSNPHPHGQIWATSEIPYESKREDETQRAWWERHRRTLLSDYLAEELRRGERVVCQNDHWAALVPWWAKWPFETILLPKRAVQTLPDLTYAERHDLADVMRRLATRYDNLFRISFPYTMGFHQAPTTPGDHTHWHLHAHFYPPLLRSATVQKFMVGFEMLGMAQRDLTPETAAEQLRALSETHYKSPSAEAEK